MLNFIGCGSAFNTKLGNNGAFFKEGSSLFMIDCGSSTFERIQRSNLLDGVEAIVVLMTHTHADHVGSLGDLILYSYYSMGEFAVPKVLVIAPYDLKIKQLLTLMGIAEDTYLLSQLQEDKIACYDHGNTHIEFEPVKVNHVAELNCYGYIIYHKGEVAYYSGDSNEIPDDILEMFHDGRFDLFYQDTCKADYPGNVHLSLRELDEKIEHRIRDKVYCMHLDGGFNKEEAEYLGFNVVSPII